MTGYGLCALSSRVLLFAVVACAPPRETADTSSALTIDTVKPATSAMQGPIGATTTADSTPSQPAKAMTKATPTKKTVSTKPPVTKELGRDSIIKRNPRDPRYQLPAVDTTKKP